MKASNELLEMEAASVLEKVNLLKALQDESQQLQQTLTSETRAKLNIMQDLGKTRRELEALKRSMNVR
eukprot:Awhi_evm1s1483